MTDYTELQKAAAYAAQDTIKFADEDEEMRALQQFHEEVDPETVLALIAENEANRYEREVVCANYDQLKAESERLQESHEQVCTNYNQVSYASEERGKQIDQLRAEVAGLKTGYEAYEMVKAELKGEVARSVEREILQLAEIEALRKAAAKVIEMNRQHAEDRYGDSDKAESWSCVTVLRAALGQGEQS